MSDIAYARYLKSIVGADGTSVKRRSSRIVEDA
jgi:hypothetical protein